MIFYEGPSMLDGKPIVGIITTKTANEKTGPMWQTWILRSDMSPVDAVHAGEDTSICGNCPFRGKLIRKGRTTRNTGRSCYVDVGQAPQAVWGKYERGGYERDWPIEWLTYRPLRLGAYGDPCAIPYKVWAPLLKRTAMHTGYTHQWRIGKFWRFKKWIMASVESQESWALAQSKGWRTFRAAKPDDYTLLPGETICPAQKGAKNPVTCLSCRRCDGGTGPSVVLLGHGNAVKLRNFNNMEVI